jgi:hypothetical protein
LKINNSQHFCNKLWYHVISKKWLNARWY